MYFLRNPFLANIQTLRIFNIVQGFLHFQKTGFNMKVIRTQNTAYLREIVEAFLDGNKAKMREIQHNVEICDARRKLWRVIKKSKFTS